MGKDLQKTMTFMDSLPKGTSLGDKLTAYEKEIAICFQFGNKYYLATGKLLEDVYQTALWKEHGHSSFAEWVADPTKPFNMQPRTAGMRRLCWQIYEDILARWGVTIESAYGVEPTKMLTIAHELHEIQDDKEAVLELFERAKTTTLRELQDEKEESEYFVVDLKGKPHKALSEKSGWVITISQGKPRIPMSVQNFWEIFGNHVCEIKIRRKKEG